MRLEAKPFARGGGGLIFRGKYQGIVVAAKTVNVRRRATCTLWFRERGVSPCGSEHSRGVPALAKPVKPCTRGRSCELGTLLPHWPRVLTNIGLPLRLCRMSQVYAAAPAAERRSSDAEFDREVFGVRGCEGGGGWEGSSVIYYLVLLLLSRRWSCCASNCQICGLTVLSDLGHCLISNRFSAVHAWSVVPSLTGVLAWAASLS